MGLQSLACCDCAFETRRGVRCPSLVSVVCCQSSLRRADHSYRGVQPSVCLCVCVIERDLKTSTMRMLMSTRTVQPLKKTYLRIYAPGTKYITLRVGPVAQSIQRPTKGWTVRDRIPVGTRFFPHSDRPWEPPSLL